MADQKPAGTTTRQSSTGTQSSGSDGNTLENGTPDYTPAVGDVVEFEYRNTIRRGIVFCAEHSDRDRVLTSCGSWDIFISDCPDVVFIKKSGLLFHRSDSEGCDLVKAYFAQPTFTGSYTACQQQWIEHHGLKVGDKVKVVREYENYEQGCSSVSIEGDADYVGKVVIITRITSTAIYVKMGDRANFFPYFVLESA